MTEYREVLVHKHNSKGEITWREHVEINQHNRVCIHHCPGGIIEEGTVGKPFDKIYLDVSRVVFTGKFEEKEVQLCFPFVPTTRKTEIVELYP